VVALAVTTPLTAVSSGLRRLRAVAVGASLRRRPTIADTIAEHRFVQYDPIRRPARAQDLILFQRVTGYRVGDLDRCYPALALQEDRLHTYGVLEPSLAELLHPRPDRRRPDRPYRPEGLVADVLTAVQQREQTHPTDLVAAFGRSRATNDWGGVSAATTRALEELHHHGLIRVVRRESGIKLYQAASPVDSGLDARHRLRLLTLAILRLLAPVSGAGLVRAIGQLCAHSGGLEGRRSVVSELAAAGEIEVEDVDGVRYLAPAGLLHGETEEAGDEVRFLAPFDPVVWERGRFEHLWGWAYRFEAYTPTRRFGYYALPMLWGDRAIGWVNLSLTETGRLDVQSGFAETVRGTAFRRAFALEVDRLETMLSPRPVAMARARAGASEAVARRRSRAGAAPAVDRRLP
jgi:uncharacterized protein